MDVIHVHRLLEKPVDVPEYLLVSGDLHRRASAAATDLATRELRGVRRP